MALSEGNLYRVGAMMKKLSEQSADMAVKLDTPPGEEDPEMGMDEPPMDDEPEDAAAMEQEGGDDAKVDELFKKFMAKLLDALQLYNDVTGKSEQDELPGDDKEDSVDDADADAEMGDDDDAAENDPEIDDADMGEMDDEPDDPDMESGEIPPGIKTSETDPEEDDDEDEEPMGEQEGDDEGGDEKDPPYGVGAEESAISEARKRLTAMKKKLTAKKKGKGKKVLKGGKGKLQDGLPFVHTTKGKPGAKKKRK
jgi:hypothetical protein